MVKVKRSSCRLVCFTGAAVGALCLAWTDGRFGQSSVQLTNAAKLQNSVLQDENGEPLSGSVVEI